MGQDWLPGPSSPMDTPPYRGRQPKKKEGCFDMVVLPVIVGIGAWLISRRK